MSASLHLIELIAVGLDLPESYFKHLFIPSSLSTLRPQHYPLRDFSAPLMAIEDGQVVICETHIDNVFMTLLATFNIQVSFVSILLIGMVYRITGTAF